MDSSRRPYRSELEQIFYEDVQSEFQIGMLLALNTAYEETLDYCRPPRLGLNEASDLWGHHIRAVFETGFRRFASGLSGVETESRLNSQNSYHHTWVKVGRICLTASSVQKKGGKPRPAEFRNRYAANGQLNFFENIPSLEDGEVYAVFRYGPLKSRAPSIATVSFPNEDWSTYVENIDLLSLHPEIIRLPVLDEVEVQSEPIPEIHFSPEETIQQPGTPGLRRRRPRIVGEEDS